MKDYIKKRYAECICLFPAIIMSVKHKDCEILTGSKHFFSGSYFPGGGEEG